MRIVDVEAVAMDVPVRAAGPRAPGAGEVGRLLLVRLEDEDGLVGWGQAFAYGAPRAVALVLREELAPRLEGKRFDDVRGLVEPLDRGLLSWGRHGLARFARSGIELAAWDLWGKREGRSVADLLGGARRPRVRAYASLPRYGSPEDVERAVGLAVAQGFTSLKLHQTDLDSVAAARAAAGRGIELTLDVNGAWTVEEAVAAMAALERFDLRWVEEPVWPPEDHEGLARLRRRVGIPIACGENEPTVEGFRDLVARGAADVLQPSVTKIGGLGALAAIAAGAAGVSVVPHSYYFGPGLAATLHFLASSEREGVPLEIPSVGLETPVFPLEIEAGFVALPRGAGLGSDPAPEALARFEAGQGSIGAPR
jgi:L-alanine-DL-glutamate epimerase-like enolase superfamily enzyme